MNDQKGYSLIEILIALAILTILAFIVYDDATNEQNGIITKKKYKAAYTSTLTDYDTGVVTPVYNPEKFILYLEKENNEPGGDPLTGRCRVDSTTYHKVKIGEYYDCR